MIGFAFVAAWLKAGGSAIGIPLQYPNAELLKSAMKKLYNVELNNYPRQMAYVQFDPKTDQVEQIHSNVADSTR